MGVLSAWARETVQAHILDVHIPNILVGIGASIEVPLITTLGRRVGLSPPEIADFVTLSSLCRTALDIPFGVLVEYVGVRNVMLATLLLNGFAAIVGLFIANEFTLGLFSVLSGISLGGFFLSRHIFVAGISSKRYRGMLMSFLSGLLRWAHVIGPLLTGIIATRTGDVRHAFLVAAVAAFTSFITVLIAARSEKYQAQCERSCSVVNSRTITPQLSGSDDDEEGNDRAHSRNGPHEPVGTPLCRDTLRQHTAATSHQPVVIGGEGVDTLLVSVTGQPSFAPRSSSGRSGMHSVHPSMAAGEEHHFNLSSLWATFVNNWTIIWRLGLYIVFFGALRSNRKLMLILAAMRYNLTDADVAYMLSVSFMFDACLFPLGGIIMDYVSRRFAVVPVTVSLSAVFLMLPYCDTKQRLFLAAAAFGVADALGCGLIMTLTADQAPAVYTAPFFGIMRTLADLGHVVGARIVAFVLSRYSFVLCCWFLSIQGICTALWGVVGIPKDEAPIETTPLAAPRHIDKRVREATVPASEELRVPCQYGTL